MLSPDDVRRIALALPGAVEKDHHGKPSFRVGEKGKIFATLWAEDELNVLLDEPGTHTAVETHPDECTEIWWGKKLSGAKVALAKADAALVTELLADAWECKGGKPADG